MGEIAEVVRSEFPASVQVCALLPDISLLADGWFQRRTLTSPIVTITVGREGRLFAAHEDVLSLSAYFAAACRDQYLDAESKRIHLPHEEPEILSSVLEYLYVSISVVTRS